MVTCNTTKLQWNFGFIKCKLFLGYQRNYKHLKVGSAPCSQSVSYHTHFEHSVPCMQSVTVLTLNTLLHAVSQLPYSLWTLCSMQSVSYRTHFEHSAPCMQSVTVLTLNILLHAVSQSVSQLPYSLWTLCIPTPLLGTWLQQLIFHDFLPLC